MVSRLSLQHAAEFPPALGYHPGFLTQSEAERLLEFVDSRPWNAGMKRRVQHYGWAYDYKAARVSPDSYLGPLPEPFLALAATVGQKTSAAAAFDQVIVNEYLPGQGISAHVDCIPCFGPVVASISLGSSCEMVFQNLEDKARFSLILEPLGLLVMAGESRLSWSHAIPARRSDLIEGLRTPRSRRVSLTFRTKI